MESVFIVGMKETLFMVVPEISPFVMSKEIMVWANVYALHYLIKIKRVIRYVDVPLVLYVVNIFVNVRQERTGMILLRVVQLV